MAQTFFNTHWIRCHRARLLNSHHFFAYKFKGIYYLSRVVRKLAFRICQKIKTQISCAVTTQLLSPFVFAIQIVQFLHFLNLKFQAPSHLLRLYSPICVGLDWKPQRQVFSPRGSFTLKALWLLETLFDAAKHSLPCDLEERNGQQHCLSRAAASP